MVRLADLGPMGGFLDGMEMPKYEPTALVASPALAEARVALISTAGLHRADDRPFGPGATDYRIIPGDVDFADLRLSHISVNFDRSGFQQDVNVMFPLERLRELSSMREIGSVARWHYSFMGATDPGQLEVAAADVAARLTDDDVTGALLVPV